MDRRITPFFPLEQVSPIRIGGIVEGKIEIYSLKGLQKTLYELSANHYAYFIYGKASNLLFKDTYPPCTYALHLAMKKYNFFSDQLYVEAGASLSQIARIIKEAGYQNFLPFEMIPGEIGGSIVNNAGAFAMAISDTLQSVIVYSLKEGCIIYKKEELDFSYRSSRFKKENLGIIIGAIFHLEKGKKEEMEKKSRFYQEERRKKQPQGILTLGSTFKNPLPYFAGECIEKALGKGKRIGNVKISEKHANFLEILPHATAKEVLDFIYFIQTIVYNKYTIELELEIELKEEKRDGRGTQNKR